MPVWDAIDLVPSFTLVFKLHKRVCKKIEHQLSLPQTKYYIAIWQKLLKQCKKCNKVPIYPKTLILYEPRHEKTCLLYPRHLCRVVYSFRLTIRSFVILSSSWNYFEVLHWSFSSEVYLTNHTSESIPVWSWRVGFHSMTPDPRVHTPGWGSRSKSRTPLKCFSTFSVTETTYADSWSDMARPCDMDLWAMKCRSAWPIFHGPLILPYILKTIWCLYIIFWEYESVCPNLWPQNLFRSLTYISWSSDFALYLEDYLMCEHYYLGLWVSMARSLTSK